MKRILQAFVGSFILLASASNAAEYEWRFALEEIEGSVQDAYATEFKKRMEKKTGDRVSITIYPYGTLGSSDQLTTLVQNGAIQFAFASAGHVASLIPAAGVFTLHFLLSDEPAVNKLFFDSTEFPVLEKAYREQGMELLDVVPEGWMTWTANKQLTSPEDFQGLKIRTMTSPVLLSTYETYGANPTPTPYSEVYSGLQLGILDAQVNPIFAIEEMSFYEVQEAMMISRHAYFIATVITNRGFYEGLPEDIRTALDETLDGMDEYIFELQQEYNDKRLQKIKEAGNIKIVELTDEQRAQFRELAQQSYDKYLELAGERGKKVLEHVQQAVKKAESKAGSGSSEKMAEG